MAVLTSTMKFRTTVDTSNDPDTGPFNWTLSVQPPGSEDYHPIAGGAAHSKQYCFENAEAHANRFARNPVEQREFEVDLNG